MDTCMVSLDDSPTFMSLLLITNDPPGTWTVQGISKRIEQPEGLTRAVVDDLMEWGYIRWSGHGEYLAPTHRGGRSLKPYIGRPVAIA